jgi:hypothetical protein
MKNCDKKLLLSTVSHSILSVQPTSKEKGDFTMAEFQVDHDMPLFSSGEMPHEAKTSRKQSFKTVPYSRSSKIYRTIEALAISKRLSISQLLQKMGYSSTSLNHGWLRKGTCPKHMEYVVKGWLVANNLSVMLDKQGGYQVVKGASNRTVEVQYEKVPASVPLTTQNVKDLIILCVTHGEGQLIVPLAKLLGDSITLTE